MNCCQPPDSDGIGRCFSRLAKRYSKRKKTEASQRQLLEGIEMAGTAGRSILDVGCGVGVLHQKLLGRGAERAVGIDLSPQMIEYATERARSLDYSGRTEYRSGDFVALADQLEKADICILDKVICCYPDAENLVKKSLAQTLETYAFTIPRARWGVRIVMGMATLFLRAVGSAFRPYVHSPERIEGWVVEKGFVRSYDRHTLFWMTRVYSRTTQPA